MTSIAPGPRRGARDLRARRRRRRLRADRHQAAEEQVHAESGRRDRARRGAEVRKQYPIIEDGRIARYLRRWAKEINAFALPGGPMFVDRGMFDAAGEEAAATGVMAHELSHPLLRHATALSAPRTTSEQDPKQVVKAPAYRNALSLRMGH